MAALCTVSRFALPMLPFVHIITALLIFITIWCGWLFGVLIMTISMIVGNMIGFGLGPWTYTQIGTYLIILTITGLLSYWAYFHQHIWLQACFSLLAGFSYGLIITIIQQPIYAIPNFWAYYLNGILFDLGHGIGNLIFYLIFMPILSKIFIRCRIPQKFERR